MSHYGKSVIYRKSAIYRTFYKKCDILSQILKLCCGPRIGFPMKSDERLGFPMKSGVRRGFPMKSDFWFFVGRFCRIQELVFR